MEPPFGMRIEQDSMGEVEVPDEAYYGASTRRAMLNFPISALRMPQSLIRALALIKLAAAQANVELDLLDQRTGEAIASAAEEVANSKHDEQFPVDVFQTGSATSTNMNVNEVIANRASELLGGERGSRMVHPNDHVNLGQSSNDVIPTAIHLAALLLIEEETEPAMLRLKTSLDAKTDEFWQIIKTGRTHLQDATPIRLGQEFRGYAGQAERALRRLQHAREELSQVALGGTAVGTGISAHLDFAPRALARLADLTGINLVETDNHFQAQSSIDAIVEVSGVLRTIAISLLKIANDIRWMGSGPRAGLGELVIPEVQPGSSIMPGKVNPVIAESLIQAMAQLLGNDAAIAVAAQGGTFELNTMMPVAAYNLLQSLSLIGAATDNFTRLCLDGLRATERGPALVEDGLALATALAPVIGYDAAAEIAKEAARSGRAVRVVARERLTLSPAELDRILDPRRMV